MLVSDITTMVLSNEGTFDPHLVAVGRGALSLADPDGGGRSMAARLGLGGGRQQAFDLSLLEGAFRGQQIMCSPAVPVLPAFATRSPGSLERMLVLTFDAEGESELLCLWFRTAEDSALVAQAVHEEAMRCLGQ
ncbi:unnamed protein product [Prorocentrum cordatum]|uniref:Uncharacterized protein n=1 Tax=Prorocentrum cordatum TaxID=2364126 RepID=A0ABN9XNQ1_9DINO|nr:unnamed protein product [Polarella glacialis]